MNDDLTFAKELFYQKKFKKSFDIFLNCKDYYSVGLCCLLQKDLSGAKKYWKISKNYSPASQFGLFVIDVINFNSSHIPSFFQTRAFLEVYINLFIENNLNDYCEKLISCAELLFKGNPESYKFIARALFSNGYFDIAIEYLKKSLDIFFCDPEALLIVSQCHFLIGKNEIARLYLDKLKNIDSNYYPAIIFDKILSENKNRL